MNIVVCDDNNIQLEIFKDFFRMYPSEDNLDIQYFNSGEKCIKYIQDHQDHGGTVDVAFLDVEMDGKSGLDVGKFLKDINPFAIIVFVTGYKNHAVSAFKLRALDYLLKPVKDDELEKIMMEITDLYHETIKKKNLDHYYSYKSRGGTVRVPYNEIVYFEKVNRKIRLITSNGTYEYLGTFKNVIDEIDMTLFCQCHQSFIVKKSCIRQVVNNEILLEAYDIAIPINRSSKSMVKQIMNEQ